MAERAITTRGGIRIEVAYALPDRQAIIKLDLPQGVTVGEAIEASGLLDRFPAIDLTNNPVGIYGRRVVLEQVLKTGDRVEIYRPLQADPKDRRREQAAMRTAGDKKIKPPKAG